MSEEVKEKRVKKPKSKARKIIEWVFTGIFLVLFAFAFCTAIYLYIYNTRAKVRIVW